MAKPLQNFVTALLEHSFVDALLFSWVIEWRRMAIKLIYLNVTSISCPWYGFRHLTVAGTGIMWITTWSACLRMLTSTKPIKMPHLNWNKSTLSPITRPRLPDSDDDLLQATHSSIFWLLWSDNSNLPWHLQGAIQVYLNPPSSAQLS